MKKIISFVFLLLLMIKSYGQAITKMEYWIDVDSGFGNGIDITGFTSSADISAFPFAVPGITTGIHVIGVRSMDSGNVWSHSNMFPVMVVALPSNLPIDSIEYFVDQDSGFSSVTHVSGFASGQNVSNFAFPINSSGLALGIHVIGIRSRQTDGVWSHANLFPFMITDTTQRVIEALEYFWDVDSGLNPNGIITPSQFIADLANENLSIPVPLNLSQGNHILFLRSRDNLNRWSHTNYTQYVYVDTTIISGFEIFESLSGITIYPNPFTNQITITPKENQKMRFILYNINGELVTDKVITGNTTINTEGLSPGAYTVFIWAEKNKIYKSVLVKQ